MISVVSGPSQGPARELRKEVRFATERLRWQLVRVIPYMVLLFPKITGMTHKSVLRSSLLESLKRSTYSNQALDLDPLMH